MEKWNPMKEAYDDPEFNKYTTGFGRDLSYNTKNIDLYVENIPPGLGQDGLLNLFSEYGRVLRARVVKNNSTHVGSIGFVTMESMVDAEAAMRNIDQRKVGDRFVLRVKVAYSKEEKERRKKQKQFQEETDFDDTASLASSKHKKFEFQEQNERFTNKSVPNFGRGFSREADDSIDPVMSTLGRGRGITRHPESDLRQVNNAKLNQDKQAPRKKAFSQLEQLESWQTESFGDSDKSLKTKKPEMENKKICIYCYKHGCVNVCSVCKQYYCSVECQINDWPKHRNYCRIIEAHLDDLSKARKGFSAENESATEDQDDQRSPKSKPDKNYSGNSDRVSNFMTKNVRKSASSEKLLKNKPNGSETKESYSAPKQRKKPMESSNSKAAKKTNGFKENNRSGQEKDVSLKETYGALSVGSKVEVMLTYFKSPTEFWVTQKDYLMEFMELMTEVTKALEQETTSNVIQPRLGSIYGSKFEGEWSRVRVDEIDDEEVTVYYIDFGNSERVQISNLRQLTPKMIVLPPQAVACTLSKIIPKRCPEVTATVQDIFGAPMSKFFDCHVVDKVDHIHEVNISIDGEDLGKNLLKQGLAEEAELQPERIMVCDLKSQKQLLQVGDRLKVVIVNVESSSQFSIIKTEAYEVLSEILKQLKSHYSHKNQPYKPIKGELVVARFPDDPCSLYRCEVLNVEEDLFHLFCIDYGTLGSLKSEMIYQVKRSNIAEFPMLAIRCSLFGMETFADISEEIKRKEFDAVMQEFCDSKRSMSMIVKNVEVPLVDFCSESGVWFSQCLNKKLHKLSVKDQPKKHITLPSKKATSVTVPSKISKGNEGLNLLTEALVMGAVCKVNMCYIVSTGEFYVRLMSRDAAFKDMMKELNNSIHSAPVVIAAQVGSLVAVKYSADELWYRGKVQRIQGKKCDVTFLDYANTESANLDSLRELSPSLIELPVQAIRCRLNIESPPSKEEENQFKKEFENDILPMRAVKNSPKGYMVNITVPAKKRLEFLSNMNLKLPCVEQEVSNLNFELNSVVKVECVKLDSPLRFHVQSSEHLPALIKASEKLNKRLNSQPAPLKSVQVGCYAAVKSNFNHEEAKWHRVIVESINEDKCVVNFLDYGISEETSKSSLMTLSYEDLMLPACAIACRLKGCQAHKSNFDSPFSTMGPSLIDCVKIVGKEDNQYIVDVLDCVGQCISNKFLAENSSNDSMISASSSPREKLQNKLDQQTLPDTNQLIPVFVTHINSYHDLFVSVRQENIISDFLHLMTALNQGIKTCKPLKNPSVGGLCAAKFSQDESWYRARLIDILNSSTAMVQFIDFGNCEEVALSELRVLNAEFRTQSAQAIPCCISGYETEKVLANMETLQKLKVDLLDKQLYLKVVKKLEDKYVIIVENEQGESVVNKMPTTGHKLTLPKHSDLLVETPAEKEFPAIFCHINSFDDFYCQRINQQEISELDLLQHSLQEDVSKCAQLKPCEPVVGCVYMSKFLGSWYRCVLQEVQGSKAKVKYVDYGNEEEKSVEELFPLLPERMTLPVRLLKCKLFGVKPAGQDWNDPDIQNYLKILETKQPLLIIHEEIDDAFLVSIVIVLGDIKINVADDLVSIGLAVPISESSSIKQENNPTSLPINDQDSKPASPTKKQASKPSSPMNKQDSKPTSPPAKSSASESEDVDTEELELQLQILELQKKLAMAKKKKKSDA
ncbi:tudor domain-containing protein 1-like [Biomphalaria glabrata]|uniref:Tudor domain-containing protein 1-like n=1 Tax=Biomphalaria glabrata TaxID=6526 RepID=A0A9W2YAD4_BIOGL|nr:tudor domain-containing protein 1-like [Biomphalaria glabrata]XP_055859682.1 tudor domain-containing protein 1-like [Biomphalaria glabrata]XP_055859698.1 tudor domain-containing protein 1-like [Biomphalaria glabrata]XP_055859702.1 tudor domain-containing protein 1-like [Biomphalaria glabrata]